MSSRHPEKVTPGWELTFQKFFGTVALSGSLISWAILVYFISLPEIGGLGLRSSKGVTVEYFNWHIFLMGTAFLLFMLPGTISFEIYPFTRNINKNVHGLLNTFSFICVIVGLIVILDCHNILTDTGSFKTTHGICGLITLCLFALNWLYGFVCYVLKQGGSLRGTMKPLHKRLGMGILILGITTLCIGCMEKEAKGNLIDKPANLLHAVTAVAFFALLGVVFSLTKYVDKKDIINEEYQPLNSQPKVTIDTQL